jgi:hypothetical protein
MFLLLPHHKVEKMANRRIKVKFALDHEAPERE